MRGEFTELGGETVRSHTTPEERWRDIDTLPEGEERGETPDEEQITTV